MFDVRRQDRSTGDRRRGSVLVIVLVVVAMLTLGAYTFSETMLSEAAATNMYGRRAQTRALADSGLEMVSALLSDEIDPLEISLYHDPLQFHAVTVLESDNPLLRGRFTIVAPVESDLDSRQTRFGLMDESARLNLNTILQLQLPAPAAPAESESSGDDSGSANRSDPRRAARDVDGAARDDRGDRRQHPGLARRGRQSSGIRGRERLLRVALATLLGT